MGRHLFTQRDRKRMRTLAVKQLVERALAALPRPHTEDVIDDVFLAIERNPAWLLEYNTLCTDLGKSVVNTWGGFWVANHEGKPGVQQVATVKSTLISSYSRLSSDAARRFVQAPGKKRKEVDALKLLSEYYHAHKADLPRNIRDYREAILELLTEGLSVEQAFAEATRTGP